LVDEADPGFLGLHYAEGAELVNEEEQSDRTGNGVVREPEAIPANGGHLLVRGKSVAEDSEQVDCVESWVILAVSNVCLGVDVSKQELEWVPTAVVAFLVADASPSESAIALKTCAHSHNRHTNDVCPILVPDRRPVENLRSKIVGLREAIVVTSSLRVWTPETSQSALGKINVAPDLTSWK
jgi:hypothetical protein